MIGLVIVTHGRLAEELRLAMEHVVGPQRNVAAVCIGADDDTVGCSTDVRRTIERVDTGDGVVLLTDMFGGTPSNLCIEQMARSGVEVIGGVNLPMLVRLAKVRSSMKLADAVGCAQAAGRKYIVAASDVLPHCRGTRDGPDPAASDGGVLSPPAPTLTSAGNSPVIGKQANGRDDGHRH